MQIVPIKDKIKEEQMRGLSMQDNRSTKRVAYTSNWKKIERETQKIMQQEHQRERKKQNDVGTDGR